jgi:hypothetical protein
MAVKKKTTILPVLLIAILLIGGYLYFNANSIIINTTERIASNALGVPVKIGSLQLSLADKSITLHTLKIGNPPGYKQPYIITADSILVGLNTVSQKFIDFKMIDVKGVELFFEMSPQGANLNDLKKLATGKKQAQTPTTANANSEGVRVTIQQVVIDPSTINASIAMLNKTIPPITMLAVHVSGIGQKDGGTNASDAIVQVLTQYLATAEQTVSNSGVFKQLPNLGNVQKTLGNKVNLKKLF